MKMFKTLLVGILFTFGVANAADVSNLEVQSNNHTGISVSNTTSDKYWKASPKPTTESSNIDWSQMPSGSKCGDYVMTGGKTQVNVKCQGVDVKTRCPSGFTHRNFGYFEAGGGDRRYTWCSKN